MAMKKSHTPADIAAAALQEVVVLRKKYQALDAAALAKILQLETGGAVRGGDHDESRSLAARVKRRLNGDAVIADSLPAGVNLAALYAERQEYDFILNRLLFD